MFYFALQDRPLNLSCKRRIADERPHDLSAKPKVSRTESEPSGLAFQRKETKEQLEAASRFSPPLYSYLPSQFMEKAIWQYRAQMLASNDIFRAYLQQKWNEGAAAFLPYQPQLLPHNALREYAAQPWVPYFSGVRCAEPRKSPVPNDDRQSASETSRDSKIGDSDASRPTLLKNSPMRLAAPVLLSPPISPHSEPALSATRLSPRHSVPDLSPASSLVSPGQPTNQPRDGHVCGTPKHPAPPSPSGDSNPEPLLSANELKRRRAKRTNSGSSVGSSDSYPCSICGATYPHKFELNRHVKVSHVRPHRCDQCGKGFGHRNYLKVHIETVHMGRKSHQCRLCGKYLSTGGNLNVHVRTIHLGEKKYNCPVCHRSFGQQCNMKTHMKRHFSKTDDRVL